MNLTPEQQSQLLEDVSVIKRALIGDPKFGQKGLAEDVKDLKDWRDVINGHRKYVWGVIVGSWFFICLIALVAFEWAKAKFSNGQ